MQGAESFVAPPNAQRGDGKEEKRIRALSLFYSSKVFTEKPQFFEKINFRGL